MTNLTTEQVLRLIEDAQRDALRRHEERHASHPHGPMDFYYDGMATGLKIALSHLAAAGLCDETS